MCVVALLKRYIALAQELVPLAKSDISLTKQFVPLVSQALQFSFKQPPQNRS
jgi:hypothetical protein